VSWKLARLADICEIKLGKTPSRSDKSYWDDEKLGSNIWVSIADLTKLNSRFIADSKEYITDKGASLFNPVKAGTLLMSFKLSIGKVAYANCDLYTNEAIVALPIKDGNQINSDFLFYFLKFYDWDKETENDVKLKGKTLNKAKLNEIKVPLPPLSIQQKIVAKLDAIFAEIDKATAAAEDNAKNAEALFQSYLTKVFEVKEDNFVIKSLLELANEDCSLSYGIVQPGDDFENGLPIVRPTNLTKKYISKLELKTINPILADSYRRTTLTGEELLLCVRGTTGTVSISTKELKGCNVTRGIVPIRFKTNQIDLDYAYYLFNSSVLQKQIKSKTYGAALLQINIADVKKLQIPVPKIEEQKKIVIQLESIKSYIDILKNSQYQKKLFLTDFKQSILKQAFNGDLVKE